MIFTFVDLILECLTGDDHLYPSPFEKPYKVVRRVRSWEKRKYLQTVEKMKKRGLVKIFTKGSEKFIKCTKKGQLSILLAKAHIQKTGTWDKMWRLIIFDIPEESKNLRAKFRHLLKTNNFSKLQASVYISPWPLNRSAISYLHETGLEEFIRILKVTEMDNDEELRKKYSLK